jgi:hypothetical protein
VGIVIHADPGLGDAHARQQGHRRLNPTRGIDILAMEGEDLQQLPADTVDRVQCRHGFLENHPDAPAPDPLHRIRRQLHQVFPIEPDRPAFNDAGRTGKQPHDGQGRNAFTAAGFSHQP